MTRTQALTALVLSSFLPFSAACGDPPSASPAGPGAPPPSSTPAPQTASSSTEAPPAPPVARGPRFVVRGKADAWTSIHWLGSGAVICDDEKCLGEATLVTEKGTLDTFAPLSTLQGQIHDHPKLGRTGMISYHGALPDFCARYGYLAGSADYGNTSARRSGKTWIPTPDPCADTKTADLPAPRPPRALDDALLHAPVAGAAAQLAHGAGAPPMLIAEGALHVWDGKSWTVRPAPFKPAADVPDLDDGVPSHRPARLADGTTFVPDGGYLIDPTGALSQVEIVQDDKPLAPAPPIRGVLWSKQVPWLLAGDRTPVYLLSPAPDVTARFARATPPPRETGTPPAPASPSAATATVSALGSAAPAASATADLPAPADYTPSCATPFVLLATPPHPGDTHDPIRRALRGNGELQDTVTFIEYTRDGKTYFGAQARTEADAGKLLAVAEKGMKGTKPRLTCVDALSRVPDRYSLPPGIRIVGINLTTGDLVPFD